jgi:NitT/TauT family transport system substrate-binding protein
MFRSAGVFAFLILSALWAPASAQEPVRVGLGFGLAFLPAYICEDLKLVEKYGREAHLDLKVTYERFLGIKPLQAAAAADAIDIVPLGTAPFLVGWEKAKDTPRQMLIVSGLTTLPPVLLSARPDIHTLADFRAADRIAIPAATAPQRYLLQMQAEKVLGQFDKLQNQVVVRSHPDAIAELLSSNGPVAGYFSSAPFTEIALADGRIHKVFGAADVIEGKTSFLILAATKAYLTAHPKVPDVVVKAMDEAARIIRDDPRRAAEIYLVHEPSRTFDGAGLAAILADVRDEFGSAVHGFGAFADFMSRHGELKNPPQNWEEIVTPALLKASNS